MEISEIVKKLLSEGYLTMIAGDITVTNKLKREYGTNKTVDIDKLTGDELYYKFVEDAQVPNYLPLGTSGQQYRVTQKSEGVKRGIKRALKSVNYEDLVKGTRIYYSSNQSNKLALNNYFKTDAWEESVMGLYNKTSIVIPDGSNKFES